MTTPPSALTEEAQGGPVGGPPTGSGRWVAVLGLLVGIWAIVPRYAGPELDTSDRVEVADHVVPGLVVVVVSLAALLLLGRRARGSTAAFSAGLVVTLAGCWIFATHVPLLAQAARGEVTWGAGIFHTAPGAAVLAVGITRAAVHWTSGTEETGAPID